MTFSNKVNLVIFEYLLMCLSCASMFFIWLFCDKVFRKLVRQLILKYILCRPVTAHSIDSEHIIVGNNLDKKNNPTSSTSTASSSGTCTSIRTLSKEDAIKSLTNVLHASAAIKSFDMIDDKLDHDDLHAQHKKFNDYYHVEQAPRETNLYKSLLDKNQD
jgi:hypothetical protein